MNDCVRDEIWDTVPVTFNPAVRACAVRFRAVCGTVGPFTVLKFEDQTFISHIYYRRAPTFTTDSEANF